METKERHNPRCRWRRDRCASSRWQRYVRSCVCYTDRVCDLNRWIDPLGVCCTSVALCCISYIVQVAAHNHAGSCWFVIHDKVYDVTSWLKDHPGGDKVMLKASGCAVCNVHAHTHARRHS
jgi:hypothetical protein